MTAPFTRPRKSLGQHFLRDRGIAARIVDSLAPEPGDDVLEIGPGEGVLTDLILDRQVRSLTAVEIDRSLAVWLRVKHEHTAGFRLIEGDILKQNPADIYKGQPLRIIGNLPYNITSPILFMLLEHRALIRDAVIMIQKEVAERLVSEPHTKTYGIPSVLFQIYARMRILFSVAPQAFFPVPGVHSAVVKLDFPDEPLFYLRNEALLKQLVKTAFGQRRKMLRNTLAAHTDCLGGSASKRPEQLSVAEWVELTETIHNKTAGVSHRK